MRTQLAGSPDATHAGDGRREPVPGAQSALGHAGGLVALGLTLAAVAAGGTSPALAGPATERVSVGPGGEQIDGASQLPAISGDGRFVAFSSATVAGRDDLLVRDRRTGKIRVASTGAGGAAADGPSYDPALSADGRFVAFTSAAANLTAGDTNDALDVFVNDARTGRTVRASVGTGGAQGGGSSESPAISADGRLVAFSSDATDLVPGDTNDVTDVFVRDLKAGTTERVSVGRGGAQADGFSSDPALSADGRFVAFTSQAANLVAGDRNGQSDIFVHDLRTGKTVRASLGVGGAEGNGFSGGPTLSADGRVVAFGSQATNLVPGDTNGETDVFVRYLRTGRTVRASIGTGGAQGDGDSFGAALSADGRVVAFLSPATTLVPRDTNRDEDIFVRDLRAGTTERVSVRAGGGQADDPSRSPTISADGRLVAFESEATNLVPGDTNGERDIFVRTR